MPTAQLWHTRPVFITSTFRDMQKERDYLRDKVFPELMEKLRDRRHRLEPIVSRATLIPHFEARRVIIIPQYRATIIPHFLKSRAIIIPHF